ncbi:hypothetical protein V6N11_067218 [Hibiscus sabdariffa]|uniref:Uncharacterized protein n=1 Tax=Hibiscus sabdariffa TaxID=183260 RepID=A0ABR2SR16_9ROSI
MAFRFKPWGYLWNSGFFFPLTFRGSPGFQGLSEIMGSYLEEEDQLFDTREEISSASEKCGSSPDLDQVDDFVDSFDRFRFWSMFPESVDKRRHNFSRWMGLSFNENSISGEDPGGFGRDELEQGISRISEDSGAVLRTSGLEEGVSSDQPFISFRVNDVEEPAETCSKEDHLAHQAKNLDGQIELVMAEQNQNGTSSRSQCTGSSKSVSSELSERISMPSPLVDPQLDGVFEGRPAIDVKRKVKKSWLRKLGAMAHIVDRHVEVPSKPGNHESAFAEKMKRVRPHSSSKHSKELSSLYCGQEFVAHEGSILTMKFSLDGKFLATAGEDCIVRVWKIVEDDSLDKFDFEDLDPSCLYFRMNHLSQLIPLNVDKERIDKIKRGVRRSSDSTCVIFPPKVFRVLEKPVHEFQGHNAEILALSWSKEGFLLSSSVDKTVRLWQVGCDRCLRVFPHNNYVTSVAFNPVDDNYFISGSIDGKVRFWEVLRGQVIDYTDVRDIVTAVCYRPDGKGGIVGSMTGSCRFFDIIGTRLQLEEPIYLGKKKLPGKMVTGFEFSPTDPSKVMITSADSLVRVLSGRDVVCKVKASGFRVAVSQISATFSQDGKQIISASEDSNIYIWNYANQEKSCSKVKSISSCQSFLSHNTSVAIPWRRTETIPAALTSLEQLGGDVRHREVEPEQPMPHSSPDCFSALLESLTKGSPTWPEETLPNASADTFASDACRFELKVLKSAYQSMLSSHKWGLVIVTASWDGRIRTYLNYGLPIRL